MKKIISFMHISLDGFVAGPQGEMNWIKFDQELFDHVGHRIGLTDTAMYGRVTYQLMESYWPTAPDKPDATPHDIQHGKWYSTSNKVVLSTTLENAGQPRTRIIRNDWVQQIQEVKQSQQGSSDEILLFGSPTTTHALARLGLIDGYWLFVNPIILGQGIPLFEGSSDRVKLRLLQTRPFDCGVTELSYAVDRD
jgi:dihydrofolate reductase